MENSIARLLQIIKEKPALYLGGQGISHLDAFINGWQIRDIESVEDMHIMREFQDWIQEKYGIKSSQSWSSIIRFYSINEHDALGHFFQLFDEFQMQRK